MASPMASSPSSPSTNSTESPEQQRLPEGYKIKARRPVPLTAGQEGEVREIYYRNVRSKCAEQIRDFALCATGRTFTIPIACRQQRKAMETCMVGYATREEEDAAREEWFATLGDRRRKKEEEEQHKDVLRAKKREWWADFNNPKGANQPSEAEIEKKG